MKMVSFKEQISMDRRIIASDRWKIMTDTVFA